MLELLGRAKLAFERVTGGVKVIDTDHAMVHEKKAFSAHIERGYFAGNRGIPFYGPSRTVCSLQEHSPAGRRRHGAHDCFARGNNHRPWHKWAT